MGKRSVGDGVSILDFHPTLKDIPESYTPYWDCVSGLEGAFCPVVLVYFPEGMEPKELRLLPEVEHR